MPPENPSRTARSLCLLLPILTASLPLPAQSQSPAPPAPLRFEVASIHPHRFAGDEPSDRRVFPGGRFVATATTVRTLLRIAFATDDNRMSGAPSWIDGETFDINAATAGHVDIETPEQFQQLILSLLEDRFQFQFHRERKEGPVYWLELDKPGTLGGPALKPGTPQSQPSMSSNSNGASTVMKVSGMSMANIAAAFRRPAGRPVEDHTGLPGNFDFEIEWTPEDTPASAASSFTAVLADRLGLKLQPAKGAIETLVIDRIARPSAN